MNKSYICRELSELCNDCLHEIIVGLPIDKISLTALFIETIRVTDVFAISACSKSNKNDRLIQNLNILRLGWNLAASLLYKGMEQPGFPMVNSSKSMQKTAFTLLYNLGYIALVRRGIDMVYGNILNVEKDNTKFIFRSTGEIKYQYADMLDFCNLHDLSEIINNEQSNLYGDWNLVPYDKMRSVLFKPGNFLSKEREGLISSFTKKSLERMMEKLVRPKNMYGGLIIGYDSTTDIDFHYLKIALNLVSDWRDEAGFSPNIALLGITGTDVTTIVAIIVALHLKHVEFTLYTKKRYSKLSIHNSISIWDIKKELIESIRQFTGIRKEIIDTALDFITLKPEDASFVNKPGLLMKPLLIDLGNGYLLRPISGLTSNPFFTIIALNEYRNSQFQHEIQRPREEWQRMMLYALFSGSRYRTLSVPIKIKNQDRILTDIDAAVFDMTSGEIALFQLKWQNFFFNDVKRLKSKAGNLTEKVDHWARAVSEWIVTNGLNELAKNMQIKHNSIKQVYLFAISQSIARTAGYGFKSSEKSIAIANWPQFVRIRMQVGPVSNIFPKIFSAIQMESTPEVKFSNIPLEFKIKKFHFLFEDLYSTVNYNI